MTLDNIKVLLSLTEDNSQDYLLSVLLSNALMQVCVYLGVDELPSQLTFVVDELVVARYRRIGAEGVKEERIDVLSTKYNTDDLSPYKTVLDEYKATKLYGKRLKML